MKGGYSDKKLSRVVELYFKGYSVKQAIEKADKEDFESEQSDIDRQINQGS